MTSLYQDVSRFNAEGFPGWDQSGAIITGPKVIGERVACRFFRDSCPWDRSPEAACSLGRYLNSDITEAEAVRLRAKLLRAAEAEDGVVRAVITMTVADGRLSILCDLTTTEGPVELNVNASGAVSILTPGAAP
jgi:hypothetical protein